MSVRGRKKTSEIRGRRDEGLQSREKDKEVRKVGNGRTERRGEVKRGSRGRRADCRS